MKSYVEFISEGKKGLTNAGTIMRTDNAHLVKASINFADESLETLRRKLLDKFYTSAEDDTTKDAINKCVSTFVYCLDKKLRIDEDIVKLLASKIGKTFEETSKMLSDETNKFYGDTVNYYGAS